MKRIDEALGSFNYIVGTTARLGKARGPFISPRAVARDIADISQKNKVALLFGPEDTGLANEELRLCHAVVTIPTSREFTSLNLSHAVMILCYEIFIASSAAATVSGGNAQTGAIIGAGRDVRANQNIACRYRIFES